MPDVQNPAKFEDREGDAKYNAPRVAMTLADFELLQRLGDGSFSQVVLAQHKHTKKQYAIKIIDKHLIVRHKQTKYIKNERFLLDKINSDSVCDLRFTFQDENSLYLGLEYCPNGELYDQIHRRKKLDVQEAQFYAAEIVLMLRRLRQEQVIHRDLKPENMLLSASGHLKLIDFGSAKFLGPPPPSDSDPTPKPAQKPSSAAPSLSPSVSSPTTTNLIADSATQATAATAATAAARPATTPAEATASSPASASQHRSSATEEQRSSQDAQPSALQTPGTRACSDAQASGTPTVHLTGSSAAVPAGQLPARSLPSTSNAPASTSSGELATAGVSTRASSQRATSFVGTADYVSPEVLNNQAVTYAADLWSFACVLYQMMVGVTPFKAATEYLTFQRIAAGQFDMPDFMPAPARDLLHKLLVLEANRRLGAESIHDLMKHPFFDKVDWDNLRKQTAPKFLPPVRSTAEENGVDWELRSLVAALPHHAGAVGNVSGHSGSAGHTQNMQSQDSGPDANAFMAAAAQMHAIINAENQFTGENF